MPPMLTPPAATPYSWWFSITLPLIAPCHADIFFTPLMPADCRRHFH
jgi:hypothetical protein